MASPSAVRARISSFQSTKDKLAKALDQNATTMSGLLSAVLDRFTDDTTVLVSAPPASPDLGLLRFQMIQDQTKPMKNPFTFKKAGEAYLLAVHAISAE